ncbi:MAG: hypothetical protein HYZ54_12590 [Ignavibacteriae bacterium]|nr:hypothetical protein [Ignavibacteriota bacterium]
MKTFSKLAMLCCIVATMIFVSCSDDPASTPTDKNYYPLTVGNTWTYDGIETEDKSGTTTDIDTSAYQLTTKVDASLTYQGKSSYSLIDSSSKGDGKKDTTYVSKSGSQIYTYIEILPTEALASFGINLDLGSRWVLTSDYNQASWVILADTTIKGIQFDLNGTPLTVDVSLKADGARKEISTMMVGDKSVQVQKFTTTYSIVLKTSGLEVPFSIFIDTYVSENIGIVKSELLPFTITFPFPLSVQFPPIKNNGNRETLKSYTVVK